MSEKKNLISRVISFMKHSVFKKKITRHKKKQESMVLSKQNKSMLNVSEDAKVSDLLDKDF